MRVGFTIIALILTLALPYWVYLPFIFAGVIVFPLYIEAVFLALLIDTLYGGGEYGKMLFGFPFGIVAALLVIFAAPLREHLRFNA
ncbi:hypothetical protein KW796_00635 [Candidatus Parcubacteria bacterium]|nr:hypothetical protein [Candidatus Parcubacteria bacterium]